MKKTELHVLGTDNNLTTVTCTHVHTLVIGSGAAGLNAAVQLARNGIKDILILTEGLSKGTSINTGSDKQTYYKLSLCGSEPDSPRAMAESYMTGGSMHGDLALIEAALSPRAFINLVDLGVPFPRDTFGQFVGYKTDHDPLQRATSIGPYTSREMCRKLIEEIRRLEIPIQEGWEAIQLVTLDENNPRRIAGALAMNREGNIEAFAAENVVFAVGGPGGIYKTSVYPAVHFGAIGLALMVGARARNLPESQYGMASIKFRWNVSGSYMQVIPRFISRAADGKTDEREFLRPCFTSDSELYGLIFLKGYQWPFDASKVTGGSSIIDILVYIETMVKNRRVYLDFRSNPEGFSFNGLPEEAQTYLTRSKAIQSTPLERLQAMNPNAIELYREHAINLHLEPLEIAVCAQHNNGGLAGNLWWESINISHLFPVGEVNGSHGVNRPGGSALNSGQVGGYRLAEFIANRYPSRTLDEAVVEKALISSIKATQEWIHNCSQATKTWREILTEIQARMSLAGGNIRSKEIMEIELKKARNLVVDVMQKGCCYSGKRQLREVFRIRHLCYAHAVYLDAVNYEQQCNVGSRGSSLVVDLTGRRIHQSLDDGWKMLVEDPSYRAKVLETEVKFDGTINHEWVDCHPIPEKSSWFETIWAEFRNGEIYTSW